MEKLSKKIKEKISFIFVIIFFLILSFLINKIPSGYIIAGGDFTQLVNPVQNFKDFLFTFWDSLSTGGFANFPMLFLFSAFRAFLYFIGLSYANIANVTIFLFLILSFFSFYISIKIINKNIKVIPRFILSLIYSINIFTFNIFADSSGYTGFFFIYIFIPLLFAFFGKILFQDNFKDYIYFSIIFLMSTVGYANIAFLVALIFLQIVFLIIFIIIKKIRLNFLIVKKVLLIFSIEFSLSLYFLLPWFLMSLPIGGWISEGSVLGSYFDQIVHYQYGILYNFSLSMTSYKYPFANLYSSSEIFVAITLGYIIFIFIELLLQKKDSKKHWIGYLIFTVVLFILMMRIAPPFDSLNTYIYEKIPIFKLFRSANKLFVFYPFFSLTLMGLLFTHRKINKKIINIILILILFIPIPYYIGGIPKYLKASGPGHQEWQHNYAIQIPEEYNDIKSIVDKDKKQLTIISIPSGDMSYYPKWNYVGVPILGMVYNKNYMVSFTNDHCYVINKSSFMEYNNLDKPDLEKLLSILKKFSCQFIILHKDVDPEVIKNSSNLINSVKELEKADILRRVVDNDYFTLYELDDSYIIPILSSDKNEIYFQKINPVKYKIFIPNVNNKLDLDFHRAYHYLWKIYIEPRTNVSKCQPIEYYSTTNTYECEYKEKLFEYSDLKYLWKKPAFESTHQMVKDYANRWEIDPEYVKKNYPEDYYKVNPDGSISLELVIYFKAQTYFYFGIIIIILAGTSLLVYLIYKKIKSKKSN